MLPGGIFETIIGLLIIGIPLSLAFKIPSKMRDHFERERIWKRISKKGGWLT